MPVSTARPTSVSSPRAVACMTTQSASTAVSPSRAEVDVHDEAGAHAAVRDEHRGATVADVEQLPATSCRRPAAPPSRRPRRRDSPARAPASRTVTVPSASSISPSTMRHGLRRAPRVADAHQPDEADRITGLGASPVARRCAIRRPDDVDRLRLTAVEVDGDLVAGVGDVSRELDSAGKSAGMLSIYSAPALRERAGGDNALIAPPPRNLVSLEAVSRSYSGEPRAATASRSASPRATGSASSGRNGGGKTTLLRLLGRLEAAGRRPGHPRRRPARRRARPARRPRPGRAPSATYVVGGRADHEWAARRRGSATC